MDGVAESEALPRGAKVRAGAWHQPRKIEPIIFSTAIIRKLFVLLYNYMQNHNKTATMLAQQQMTKKYRASHRGLASQGVADPPFTHPQPHQHSDHF
jgi:hypothetical protein